MSPNKKKRCTSTFKSLYDAVCTTTLR